LCAFT
jgi:peroxiredoxin